MTPELREHLERHLSWPDLPDPDRCRFLTLALCGEIGELAHDVWVNDISDDNLIKEIGDVGNYVFMLAIHMDVDMPVLTTRPFDSRTLEDLTLELVGAGGQLANFVKKVWRGDTFEPRTARLRFDKHVRKIGDALFTLATYLDIDLYAVMLAKLIEVEQRPEYREKQT